MIVYPRLIAGGEERIIIDHLRYLDRSKYQLFLCLFQKRGDFVSEIPEDVLTYDLNKRAWWDVASMIVKLTKILNNVRPDIVLSSLWYTTAIVSFSSRFCPYPFKFIAREPHNHKKDCSTNTPKNLIKRAIMDYAHKRPDIVITVSRGSMDDISKSYGIPLGKMKVIYNSVDITKINQMIQEPNNLDHTNKPRIVTLGRLIPRKGFDLLMRSFNKVRMTKMVELVIIGEGSERKDLELLAQKLEISDSVKFLGYQPNPYKYIANSTIFVCSSFWEGFGNVIIEAMACGVPVISTRCPSGPDEIITDGINGLLVPVGDEEALANSMTKLLNDEPLRQRLVHAGKKRAEDFSVGKIVPEYEQFFDEVARGGFHEGVMGW